MKSWFLRYGLAVTSVGVALVITNALQQYTDITPLFYAAIVVTAWFGGMGPGLLAVVLAEISIDYFFVEPLYTLEIGPKHISFLLVFGFLAVLTSWMSAKRKHAQEALREARDELEVRVQERTAELASANEGLQREIAEKRLIEAALRGSEERYRQIVECANDTIYRVSPTGYFTFVNRSAAALVKRAENECVGLHFTELIRSDYREKTLAFYAKQIGDKLPITYFEFPAIAKDGAEVWIGQNVAF